MSLDSFPDRYNAIVVGASGGIGLALTRLLLGDSRCARVYATCRHPSTATALQTLAAEQRDRLHLQALDLCDEDAIAAAARAVREQDPQLHVLINAAGVLQQLPRLKPERRLEDLHADSLAHSFAVNAIGPMLVARHFASLLTHGERAVFATLSARVGSIGDNRLGGWYAYRAAKAAQNQFTRTFSIEMARRAPRLTVLALHPGTVDTALSRPFQAGVAADRLFAPHRAAEQLLRVIDTAGPAHSGRFLAWDGSEIPW